MDNINTNIHDRLLSWLGVGQGRIQEGAHPGRAPPQNKKKKIFWRKILIFHRKYPKHFRASLRSAQFF
jgi:hypothetical protein